MKPLTIEELKALAVGDWVWIVYVPTGHGHYDFIEEHGENAFLAFDMGDHFAYTYKDYGVKWIAYKNKECACELEQKNECCYPDCSKQAYCYYAQRESAKLEVEEKSNV